MVVIQESLSLKSPIKICPTIIVMSLIKMCIMYWYLVAGDV